jgi:Spy/CpxP family protein refolding chaperone
MPHHESGMMPMWGMASDQQIDRAVDTLQRTLSLSPAQVTSIRQLARERRESYRTIHSQARPKLEQLRSLLEQPNPDPATVGRFVVDLKAIHEQARVKQKDVEKQLSGILNPTQQQTVDNLRKQAQTFMALRSIGLLGVPGFPHGMFMSLMGQSIGRGSDDY